MPSFSRKSEGKAEYIMIVSEQILDHKTHLDFFIKNRYIHGTDCVFTFVPGFLLRMLMLEKNKIGKTTELSYFSLLNFEFD